jgi:hypothetical protein
VRNGDETESEITWFWTACGIIADKEKLQTASMLKSIENSRATGCRNRDGAIRGLLHRGETPAMQQNHGKPNARKYRQVEVKGFRRDHDRSVRAKIAAIASLGQHGWGARFDLGSCSCGEQSHTDSVDTKTEVLRGGSARSLARKTDWRRSYRGVHDPSVARKIEARRDCASTL